MTTSSPAASSVGSPYLRRESTGNYLWILAVLGLLAFAAASGVALAYGELAAFYIALSVIGGMAVMYDFRIGAVLLLVMLPMGATHLFPHSLMGVPGLNPNNILIVATLASFVLRGGHLSALAPKPLVWLYIVPILIAGAIGMPHVLDIPVFFEQLQYIDSIGYFREEAIRPLLIVAVAMLLGAAVARSKKPESFLIPVIVSVWIIALIEIGFIVASGVRLGLLASANSRRFFDEIGMHANDLGRLFAVAYGLLLFVWWETKNIRLKTALFFTLNLAALALILSFSRGAFLGFFLINGLFLAWKFNAKTVSMALIVATIICLIAPEFVWNRITFGFNADANAVSADRIDGIWLPLLPEIWKSPIWGNGLSSIMWSSPMQAGTMLVVGHPHNAYLEAVLDMGFVGLALLAVYFVHVWRGFRALGSNQYIAPEMRAFFQGATAGLLCFAVTGWAGSSLRPEDEFAYLWVAIGMMYGMLARKPAKPVA
jgi:O-antigen ligase